MSRPHFGGLLTDDQKEFATEVAEKKGLSVEEFLRRLIDDGLEKVQYIERSKPRERKTTGRQPDSPEVLECKRLGDGLRRVYASLREEWGIEFDERYGSQETALLEAIKWKNLEILRQMDKERPWLVKKW